MNCCASEYGPIPEVSERNAIFAKIRAEIGGVLEENDMQRLADRFIEPSFGDRARFYTEQRGWDSGFYDEIRQLYNLRNQAVHGDPVVIGTDEARPIE